MFQAYGLYSHIQANRVRSIILLGGFVLLLQALTYSLLVISAAIFDMGAAVDYYFRSAWDSYLRLWPMAMLAALAWFGLAYLVNTKLVNFATGAHGVTREEAPKLYNALENLCISRGIPMPKLQIIENPALNAFASGLNDSQYAVTVTRGLLDTLNDREIEAVLAHELTHIRNRDTQLMVVAIIFAGIFAFFGDLFIRGWDFPYGFPPRGRHPDSRDGYSGTSTPTSSDSDDRDRSKGGGGAIIAIIIAIVIILITYGISTLIRFALSRSREYLADAGAVELTKDPDALISALRKIDQNAQMDVPSRMEAFFIENPLEDRITGWFATHPSMSDRIDALIRYAGGHPDLGNHPQPMPR